MNLKTIGVLIGVMTGALAVHGAIVVPSILYSAREDMEKLIDRHSVSPHPRAVSREEYEHVIHALERLETKVDAILQAPR